MVINTTFYSTSLIIIKLALRWSSHISSYEIMAIRTVLLSTVFFLQGWFLHQKNVFSLNWHQALLALSWTLVSCGACISSYVALRYAPLGLVSILFNLCPLIASCLAALILKEQIKILNYISMGAAFVGVILLNSGSKSEVSDQYPFLEYGLFNGMIFAILISLVQIIIKLMNRTLHFIYTAFYSGFAGTWIILYCLVTNYQFTFSKFDTTDFLLVIFGTSFEIVGINTNSIAFNYGEI